uniref:F-box domain-containing protein n=1 Tax=Panagrellus redivivus TaxID=6233 RepID=A0A7E4VCT1_PANRE
MPYPLEKLPYGLRRRLRELTTPAEANALQIAAPNYYGLLPIQRVKSIDQVKFVINNDSILLLRNGNTRMNLPRDNLVFRICLKLYINNFMLSDGSELILERFQLAPRIVKFKDCVIDSTFIQSLVPCLEQQVSRLELNNCTIPERKTAHIICNAKAFKLLRNLCLIHCKTSLNSWIDGFLDAKAQNDNFQMQIYISVPFIQVQSQLKALFGSHFTCLSERPKNQQKYYVLSFRKMKYVYDDDDVFYSLDGS